jgi:hypothetical protein
VADRFIYAIVEEKCKFDQNSFQLIPEVYHDPKSTFLANSSYILFKFSRAPRIEILEDVARTILIILCRFDALNFKDKSECFGSSPFSTHKLSSGMFYVSDKLLQLIPRDDAIVLEISDIFLGELLLLCGIISTINYLFSFSDSYYLFIYLFIY